MTEKKKNLIRIGVLLFVAMMVILIIMKVQTKKRSESLRKTIPDFEFFTLDKKPYTQNDLPASKPVIFCFFSPGCHLCSDEAKEVVRNYQRFNGTEFLWVSDQNRDSVAVFAARNGLMDLPGTHVLLDSSGIHKTIFDVNGIPGMFIYNARHELVKEYVGAVKTEAVLFYIKDFLN